LKVELIRIGPEEESCENSPEVHGHRCEVYMISLRIARSAPGPKHLGLLPTKLPARDQRFQPFFLS